MYKLGNAFSKSLQRHYVRLGNRIVFNGGYSLNQLALEMSERLHFKEIDVSVLSRVLKGERLFTQKQLSIFSEILHINKEQKQLLKTALHSVIYKRFQGRYLLEADQNQFVDMAKDNLTLARQANQSGASLVALRWSEIMESRLREEILKSTNLIESRRLKDILFEYLDQHSVSILRREMASKAYSKVWSVLEEMQHLAESLRNSEKLGLVYTKMGDVLSLVGGENEDTSTLNRSSDYFKKALGIINSNLYYYPIGYWMLNEAYLKNTDQVKKLGKICMDAIAACEPADACEGYNLIAKAKVLVGDPVGLETIFENAWRSYKSISDNSFNSKQYRKVQLSRTSVQAYVSGYKFYESSKIKQIFIDCTYSAKSLGYTRYYLTAKSMVKGVEDFRGLGPS